MTINQLPRKGRTRQHRLVTCGWEHNRGRKKDLNCGGKARMFLLIKKLGHIISMVTPTKGHRVEKERTRRTAKLCEGDQGGVGNKG